MKVTILGSGTLLPDDEHHSAAHLVEVEGASILLDCGAGTLHGLDRYGADWTRVSHLFLSHFHTDHTGDVAALLWARKHGLPDEGSDPFTVLGPVGLTHHLQALARAHGEFILHPGGPLEVVELGGVGSWTDPGGRFRLAHHPTPHTEVSLGVRVEAGGVSLGYTGDTGPSSDLATFMKGVELLISECSGMEPGRFDNHLSAPDAARLAQTAGPALLVLTHLYPEVDRKRLPDLLRASGYIGRMREGVDGLVVRLTPGRARIGAGAE